MVYRRIGCSAYTHRPMDRTEASSFSLGGTVVTVSSIQKRVFLDGKLGCLSHAGEFPLSKNLKCDLSIIKFHNVYVLWTGIVL